MALSAWSLQNQVVCHAVYKDTLEHNQYSNPSCFQHTIPGAVAFWLGFLTLHRIHLNCKKQQKFFIPLSFLFELYYISPPKSFLRAYNLLFVATSMKYTFTINLYHSLANVFVFHKFNTCSMNEVTRSEVYLQSCIQSWPS